MQMSDESQVQLSFGGSKIIIVVRVPPAMAITVTMLLIVRHLQSMIVRFGTTGMGVAYGRARNRPRYHGYCQEYSHALPGSEPH